MFKNDKHRTSQCSKILFWNGILSINAQLNGGISFASYIYSYYFHMSKTYTFIIFLIEASRMFNWIKGSRNISKHFLFEFLQLHNLDLRWSIMNSSCSKKFLSWPSTFQFAMVGNLTCQIWLWRMNEKGKWTLIETNVVLAPSTADASFEFESCVNITKLTTQRNWIGLRAKRKSVGVCQKRAQIVTWPVTIGEKLRSRFGTDKLFSWKKINAFLYFSNDSQNCGIAMIVIGCVNW